jgi:mitogen-activated protein kinase 1/3
MIAADLKGDPDNHAATPTDESPDNHATSTVVDGAEGSGTLQTNGAYHHFMVNGSEFRVDRKYSPLKALGHGAYGVVCSALNTETNAYVAIKKVPLAFEDRTDAKRMLRECKLLNHFDHENIVALRDIIPPCQEPFPCSFDDIYFVMDLMETDLHKIIYSSNELTDDHLQYFIYQILRGLQYVHSANVIHRDLKPSNLLLNSSCDIKLCDFGLARGVNDEEDYELTEYVVTRHYRAPEVMCCNQHYDHKIDVWSAGCILAELHGREPIFPGDDYLDQMNLIFSVLGTPSDSDMKMITNSKAGTCVCVCVCVCVDAHVDWCILHLSIYLSTS